MEMITGMGLGNEELTLVRKRSAYSALSYKGNRVTQLLHEPVPLR